MLNHAVAVAFLTTDGATTKVCSIESQLLNSLQFSSSHPDQSLSHA